MTDQPQQPTPPVISESKKISILRQKKKNIEQQQYRFKFKWWGVLLFIFCGCAIMPIVIHDVFVQGTTLEIIGFLFLGGYAGFMIYALGVKTIDIMITARLTQLDFEIIKASAEELQENTEINFFTKLVQINFKYIDQYYFQTKQQADKSFWLSAFAGISGFCIVVFGIFMLYYNKIEQPAYVTTSAGIISEFIAAVFFYLYNRTILKMSQYHQKLVMTQNISLALKISEDMNGESKMRAQEMLIDRLTNDVNKYLLNSDR